MNEANTISLGKPALGVDTAIIASIPTNNAASSVQWLTTPWVSDVPYGRPIVFTPLGAPTNVVMDVLGEDYLGQPVTERFTATTATAQNGKKAFYRVLAVRTVTPTGGAVGAKIGTYGSDLGLPFKGSVEWAKEAGALIDPSTAFSKWVAPDLTDPATNVTGDPRGKFTATAAFDGVKEFVIGIRADNSINANNNGGLHGIRQFGG